MKIIYRPILPVVILLCLSPVSVLAEGVLTNLANFFKNSDQRAAQLLESGDVEAANALFKDSQWRGVGQYRAGNYEEAMDNFSLSEGATALYNHGTAAAQAGDYNQSVASLEAALELAPDDEQIKQNLEIARELKKLSDQNEQQSDGQSGQQPENQESGDGSESQDQAEGGEPSDEPQSDENQSGESQQEAGELDSQQQDNPTESDSTEDLDNLREEMQQSQADNENSGNEERDEKESSAPTSVSEDDQATEQWLRRIPDDGSQLLRNKIRLNHLIEYPDVDDMQENW